MISIRWQGSALLLAGALCLPALASAEQAPSALCDGAKSEQKQQATPTADRTQQKGERPDQKVNDKQAPRDRDDNKTESSERGKTS
jgi:hypothetical protein